MGILETARARSRPPRHALLRILGVLALIVLGARGQTNEVHWLLADVIPSGHKAAVHELVFEELDLLDGRQLFAGPLAGFSGPKLIEAGVPFRFSTKYGTRLFVVPAGIRPPPCEYPLPEIYSTWPSLPVPIAEHHSVSQWSRVARELTTLQLVGLKEGVPEIKVIRTQSFDEAGNPIHGVPLFWVLSGVCTVGVLLLLCFLRKRTRVSRNPTPGPLP